MNAIFDTLDQAVELGVYPNEDIKRGIRWVLDALHEVSHQHEDWLNRDRHLAVEGERLLAAIKKLRGQI